MVTSGALTTRLDRLEALGCIRRTPDPADRRGVLVSLTDQGKTIAGKAFAAVMAAEATFLEALGASDRRHLDTSLRKLALQCRPAPLGA
jgi:DNA-binding MarR family transcriptional regulator